MVQVADVFGSAAQYALKRLILDVGFVQWTGSHFATEKLEVETSRSEALRMSVRPVATGGSSQLREVKDQQRLEGLIRPLRF